MLIERKIDVVELGRIRKIRHSGHRQSLSERQSRGRVLVCCKLLEYVHRWVFNHPPAAVRPPEIPDATPGPKYGFLIFGQRICDACARSPAALVQANRRPAA